ncbi:MAG: aminotransferase class V-fold PLP-dependent enzyme [Lentisphaerae bacterium]|nr:aminotransferase class V-fold PLP-dependent enzyme [Lentisphaerota bacterium]
MKEDTDISRYFDYAASAPPFPAALDVFSRASASTFANPSSAHAPGAAARAALEHARAGILRLAGAAGRRLVFTSGATEANNQVIRGVMDANPRGRLLIAADVHSSAWFAKKLYGSRVDVLTLRPGGITGPDEVAARLGRRTVLCSIAHACNETGIVHDVAAIAEACAAKGVLLHCDGSQALGHIPVDAAVGASDFYTFSGHKFGAPRGSGGVICRRPPPPLVHGGGQEDGARSGTENNAAAAATATALECSAGILLSESMRLRGLAVAFADSLLSRTGWCLLNSAPETGLPGLLSFSFPGLSGHSLAAELGMLGFAVSTGSACQSGEAEPSRALVAAGRSRDEALGSIRVSMGRGTTAGAATELVNALAECASRQRRLA